MGDEGYVSLIVVIISHPHRIHVSKHHIAHLKCIQRLSKIKKKNSRGIEVGKSVFESLLY